MPALKRDALSLARFLLAGAQDRSILNDAPPRMPAAALGERLAAAAIAAWRGDVMGLAALEDAAAELTMFDPAALAEGAERTAFWIDVYNALALHAALRFNVRDSVREVAGFFNRAAYCIGGARFSLTEIEHGVLRGNRPPLPGLPPPFASEDARLALVCRPPDPRIHFVLHCATRSCPLPRPYRAETLENDLDVAVAAFLLGGGIEVVQGRVQLSALFAQYGDDFGGEEGVRAFVLRYLPPGPERDAVSRSFQASAIDYAAYDWALPPQ